MTLRIIKLTIVVSAMDPKLLIKMLQVTFTGGPAETEKRGKEMEKLDFIRTNSTDETSEQMIKNSNADGVRKVTKTIFCRG